MRGQGNDVLLVLGFAFDPRALGTVEEFKASLSESDIEYFKADAIRDNCVKFLADNAKVEE